MVINSQIHSYFACKISKFDVRLLGIVIGNSDSQQKCEALTVLVAIKLWISVLAAKKLVVALTSDNIAALSLVAEMKAKMSTLIARELALILSETAFQPRFIQHLPGVMNQYADALSRIYEPGSKHEIPQGLRKARRLHPPLRDAHYYSTLAHTPQGGDTTFQ